VDNAQSRIAAGGKSIKLFLKVRVDIFALTRRDSRPLTFLPADLKIDVKTASLF